MNGKLANPQSGVLLVAVVAAVAATCVGLMITGGFSAFSAAFSAGQGIIWS